MSSKFDFFHKKRQVENLNAFVKANNYNCLLVNNNSCDSSESASKYNFESFPNIEVQIVFEDGFSVCVEKFSDKEEIFNIIPMEYANEKDKRSATVIDRSFVVNNNNSIAKSYSNRNLSRPDYIVKEDESWLENNHWAKENKKKLLNTSTKYENDVYRFVSVVYPLLKIKRQYALNIRGKIYFLDIFIPEINLCIEVDGAHHFTKEGKIYDQKRDKLVFECAGIHTFRIPDHKCMSIIDIDEWVRKSLMRSYQRLLSSASLNAAKRSVAQPVSIEQFESMCLNFSRKVGVEFDIIDNNNGKRACNFYYKYNQIKKKEHLLLTLSFGDGIYHLFITARKTKNEVFSNVENVNKNNSVQIGYDTISYYSEFPIVVMYWFVRIYKMHHKDIYNV